MGRLIHTGDLFNKLQAYGLQGQDGFGMFRDTILGVVERIIMDCETVEVNDITTEILEIIDWRMSLLGNTTADELIKQELHIIKEEIERVNK